MAMTLTTAADQAGATAQALDDTVAIAASANAGAPPYKRQWYLRLPWATAADGITIDALQTWLKAQFLPWQRSATTAEKAAWVTDVGASLRLDLPAPWPLRSLRFTGSSQLPTCRVDIHRFDGEIEIAEPTISQPCAADGSVDLSSLGFVAQRCMLRVKKSDDTNLPLSLSMLHSLVVDNAPASPRLAISLGEERQAVWSHNGQSTTAIAVGAGAELAAAVQRLLDRAAKTPHLDLILIAESDQPCQFQWTPPTGKSSALQMAYSYAAAIALPGDGGSDGTKRGKLVLRFAGDRLQNHDMDLPAPAQTQTAKLTLTEHRSPQQQPVLVNGQPLNETDSTVAREHALQLDTTHWAATSLILPNAMACTGLAMHLQAATDMILAWRLENDDAGTPNGAALAEGHATLSAAVGRTWLSLQFEKKLALAAGTYWFLAQAVEGHGYWAAINDGSGASSSSAIVTRTATDDVWTHRQRFEDLGGECGLIPTESARTSDDFRPAANYRVTCAGQPIPRQGEGPDKATYNLSAAITSYRAQAGIAPDAPVPLRFESSAKLMLTVYEPAVGFTTDSAID